MPIKIGEKYKISIDLAGNLYKLPINKINLISDDQEIYLSGMLENIIVPDKFVYKIDLSETKLTENSLKKSLPEIDFSTFPNFTNLSFKKLFVTGSSDFVKADLDFNSSSGKVQGYAELDYSNLQRYSAKLNVKDLNLSSLIKSKDYQSNLNGNIDVSGNHFNLNALLLNLRMNLINSTFQNIYVKRLNTVININEVSKIEIDSLFAEIDRSNELKDKLEQYDIFTANSGYIKLNGVYDITSLDNPIYDIDAEFNAIDLRRIFQNDDLPTHISATAKLTGKGLNVDSLNGKYSINVEELLFEDRAVFPFKAELDISGDELNRSILINSDYLIADMRGKFLTSNLLNGLAEEGVFLGEFINQKLKKISPEIVAKNDSLGSIVNLSHFPNIEGIFKAEIRDISILNTILDSIDLNTNMTFNVQIESDSVHSTIKIDTLDVKFFKIVTNDLILQANNLTFNSELHLKISDHKSEFESFDININNCDFIIYNNTKLVNPRLILNFDGETAKLNAEVGILEQFHIASQGNISLNYGGVDFRLDSADLIYQDSIKWSLKKPLFASSYQNNLSIDTMVFAREHYEEFDLSGSILNNVANNIQLNFKNLDVNNILKIFNPELYYELKTLELVIDTAHITINGNLDEPVMNLDFISDSLYFNGIGIGRLDGKFVHNKDNIVGGITVINEHFSNKEVMNLKVNYLPLYLGLDSTKELFTKKDSFDIRLNLSDIPAGLLQPFAPSISQLSGELDANLIVDGNIPDNVQWRGDFNLHKGSFKVDNTNISYEAELRAKFIKDKINIEQLVLRNKGDDVFFGRIGRADITGFVNLENFKPGYMDLKINADRLLALSEKSAAVMPDLYGNFIISSDENPIRFYGTLAEPNLEGDINVMYASIKMPLLEKRKAIKTSFTYYQTDGKYKIKVTNTRDSSLIDDVDNNNEQRSIAELMNYDLRIKILGQFNVIMDMNLIGEMNAVIGTPDKTVPLRYLKNRNQSEANLFGEVVVKEPSIIKSLKQFTTIGNISFPTGSIENPKLDLTAIHKGTSYSGETKSQYIIKMYITGTKLDPKVRFTYFIDGVEASGSQEQINEDALYLLALGRTKSSGSQSTGNSNLLNEGLSSGFSNFATKAISELLASTGVIQSAALDFRGGSLDLNQATVKFSGQIYGGISWTFGGAISDISGTNEITIDIPASEFLANPFWSNFVLQLTKASTSTNSVSTQEAKNWEVKVKFGSSW